MNRDSEPNANCDGPVDMPTMEAATTPHRPNLTLSSVLAISQFASIVMTTPSRRLSAAPSRPSSPTMIR
jgi:hypothetical protein